ncbi:MAG: hypothetical protein AAGG72_06395 [Pseudomonadota bacterium]
MQRTTWEHILRLTLYMGSVGILAVTSIYMNMSVGWDIGMPEPLLALPLALVAMSSDIIKAFLPFMWLSAINGHRPAYLVALLVLGTLMIGYSWSAGYVFSTAHRLSSNVTADNQTQVRTYNQAELTRVNAALQNRSTKRSADEVQADSAATLQTRVNGITVDEHTNGCRDVDRIGRRTCQRYAELQVELAAARRYDRLLNRKRELETATLTALQNAKPHDGAAFALSELTGWAVDTSQKVIGVVFTTLCELANLLALVLFRRLVHPARETDHAGAPDGPSGSATLSHHACPSGANCPHENSGVSSGGARSQPTGVSLHDL